jgi:hypothetical protein
MNEERFDAVSEDGTRVVVRWRGDVPQIEIRVGPDTDLPAWGRTPGSRAEVSAYLLRARSGRVHRFTQDAEKLISSVESDVVAAVRQP